MNRFTLSESEDEAHYLIKEMAGRRARRQPDLPFR